MDYKVKKVYICKTKQDIILCLKTLFNKDYDWHLKVLGSKRIPNFDYDYKTLYVECWNDKSITVSDNLQYHEHNPKVYIFNSRKIKLNRINE